MRLTRGFISIISLAAAVLAVGGIAGVSWFATSEEGAAKGYERLLAGETAGAVEIFEAAVRRDAASPYRWCDLAEAELAAGEKDRARRAMGRAVDMGPRIVPVLMRAANFYYRMGEERRALPYGARILRLVEQYDGAVFGLYDRMEAGVDAVLREGLGGEARAGRAYLRHVMGRGDREGARAVWEWVSARRAGDDRTADDYVRWLLGNGEYGEAAKAWARHTAGREPGYPGENCIYNGSFEREPAGTVFDWRMAAVKGAEVVREEGGAKSGKWSLRVRFDGTENVAFGHVSQRAVVGPGEYSFEAWVRPEEVSTNEGVGLRVFDAESAGRLDVRTERFRGTTGWTRVERKFRVPEGTRLVEVRVVREPSWKFDNKIAGSVWIDEVSLKAVSGSCGRRQR